MTSFKASARMLDDLRAAAAERQTTMGALIRSAIEAELARCRDLQGVA